jgi:hypothetical protein
MDPEEFAYKKAKLEEGLSRKEIWQRCKASPIYFVFWFVEILSSEEETWIPFQLWPSQADLLKNLELERRIILLKARQLGFTTLVIAYLLWRVIFYPVATVGLFSKGELEAMELLDRLVKGYHRLPKWMQADRIIVNNAHLFELSTGSWARAMSTRKGESFTFRYLFLDELDRFENAAQLIKNVKPAADAANAQIIAGSISDKDHMETVFKAMYLAATEGKNDWHNIFLSWKARPDRDQAWYDAVVSDAISRYSGDVAGAMDEIYQQYPETEDQALSPRKQGKRIPFIHLDRIYTRLEPLEHSGPAVPELKIYVLPQPEHEYVLGADPAEGVEGGSDSSLRVFDKVTGEEVAALKGKFEPKVVFPKMIFDIAVYYNYAEVLPERNNHGHAVIAGLNELIAKDYSKRAEGFYKADDDKDPEKDAKEQPTGDLPRVWILNDPADRKEGWLTSPSGSGMTRGKVAMYDNVAQQIKDEQLFLHDPDSFHQLASIDINKLRNLDGFDDCADACALAASARLIPGRTLKGQLFF